jgi:catechol 2,3-dioxygenase-like lactoylglutathione lyase family enzyme
MAIIGVHHVQLAMPAGGEAAARGFYSGLLGIPEVPKPAKLAKAGGAWFETAAVRVHLGIEADFRPAKKAHPGLLVEELGLLIGCLKDAGCTVVSAEPMAGHEHVYVHDPFGNRLELLQVVQNDSARNAAGE